MKKGFLLSGLVAVSLLTSSVYAKGNHHKKSLYSADKKIAKKAIKTLMKDMKKNFKSAMKKDGPVGAVNFCSNKAEEIIANTNKNFKNGVSIKRVTLKPRNPKDQANDSETAILTSLEALQGNGVVLPKMLVQKVDKTHTRVFKPIIVQAKCLICHGTQDKLDPKAYEAIKAKYPNDKATGYKAGDLRGAFVVDIVKK